MKELNLSQRFSMIVLNAQDSINMTTVKKVSLRAIATSVILESYLDGEFSELDGKLVMKKEILNNPNVTLYKEVVLKSIFRKNEEIKEDLNWWLSKASNLSNSNFKRLEVAIADSLKGCYLMEEVPSLLGCDMLYKTAGLTLKEYRSDIAEYTKIIEYLKADVLEEGIISDESIFMLWLLKESGCMQDVFSKSDLELVQDKVNNLVISNKFNKGLYSTKIHHGLEIAVKGFLNMKKNAIKTPTGTGINFVIPILDRSQSIFIDTERWFSNGAERLEDLKNRLDENGHIYDIIRGGNVPLIKIDNIIYEAIPEAVQGRVAIHGVRLRRYIV